MSDNFQEWSIALGKCTTQYAYKALLAEFTRHHANLREGYLEREKNLREKKERANVIRLELGYRNSSGSNPVSEGTRPGSGQSSAGLRRPVVGMGRDRTMLHRG